MYQSTFLGAFQAAAPVWRQGPALDIRAYHFRVDGEGIDIDVGHDGIEVHTGAMFRQFDCDDAFCLAMLK